MVILHLPQTTVPWEPAEKQDIQKFANWMPRMKELHQSPKDIRQNQPGYLVTGPGSWLIHLSFIILIMKHEVESPYITFKNPYLRICSLILERKKEKH